MFSVNVTLSDVENTVTLYSLLGTRHIAPRAVLALTATAPIAIQVIAELKRFPVILPLRCPR